MIKEKAEQRVNELNGGALLKAFAALIKPESLWKCPYCEKLNRSQNGTGTDVLCCGEIGHSKKVKQKSNNKESAAIKGSDHYKWYQWTGKKSTTIVSIKSNREADIWAKGDMSGPTIFGIRPSSSGKDIRFVTSDQISRVLTIHPDQVKKLLKNSKPSSGPV